MVSVLALTASACGPRVLTLPSGSGDVFPGFAAAFEEASRGCQGVRTMTAELQITGRAGDTRLRATVLAGLARPDGVRLEGLAPFGRPAFVFVSHAAESTLLLPRDGRVLVGQDPGAVIEALLGLRVEPAGLRAMLTGCVSPDPEPIRGRLYGTRWAAIDIGLGSTAFLRPGEAPGRIVAGRVRGIVLEFAEFSGPMPRRIRLWSDRDAGGLVADLMVRLSQVEINTTLDPAVFSVDIPRDAAPLSLEELRRAGPLGAAPER